MGDAMANSGERLSWFAPRLKPFLSALHSTGLKPGASTVQLRRFPPQNCGHTTSMLRLAKRAEDGCGFLQRHGFGADIGADACGLEGRAHGVGVVLAAEIVGQRLALLG